MKTKFRYLLLVALLSSCGGAKDSSSPSESSNFSEDNNSSQFESSSSFESSSASSEESSSSNSSEVSSSSEANSSSSSSVSSSSSQMTDSSSSSVTPVEPNKPIHNEKNMTHFLGSDGDLYRINITTKDQVFPYDKENYINGSVTVTEQNSNVVINDAMSMKIKLRGNSTMDADKKPFKIKFDEKQSLFGLTKAKNWVLLANYYDKSNIRNYLAYLTANKLTNLDFQPSSIFVDVYFNNEYYGMFLLCEQMEAKKGRVDIEDNISSKGISSFFIEADERAQSEYKGFAGSCYITSGRYDFALKSPDADDYVDAYQTYHNEEESEKNRQKALTTMNEFQTNADWLKNFMDGVSESIYDLHDYDDFIDVGSFIDYYLVEEFFKNVDVGSTSQFYYIDQADKKVKLKAGPVWDFDIAAGVIRNKTPEQIYYSYTVNNFFMASRDYYYNALFKDHHFFDMVAERYTEVRDDVFVSVFDEIETVTKILEKAQDRNLKRWPLTKERKTWIEQFAYDDEYVNISTLQGHYELVETFLQERLKVFDQHFNIN